MTQFKDKARSQQRDQDDINASHTNRESVSMGLFSYPVLMAADILLYRANLVPGECVCVGGMRLYGEEKEREEKTIRQPSYTPSVLPTTPHTHPSW